VPTTGTDRVRYSHSLARLRGLIRSRKRTPMPRTGSSRRYGRILATPHGQSGALNSASRGRKLTGSALRRATRVFARSRKDPPVRRRHPRGCAWRPSEKDRSGLWRCTTVIAPCLSSPGQAVARSGSRKRRTAALVWICAGLSPVPVDAPVRESAAGVSYRRLPSQSPCLTWGRSRRGWLNEPRLAAAECNGARRLVVSSWQS